MEQLDGRFQVPPLHPYHPYVGSSRRPKAAARSPSAPRLASARASTGWPPAPFGQSRLKRVWADLFQLAGRISSTGLAFGTGAAQPTDDRRAAGERVQQAAARIEVGPLLPLSGARIP